MQIFFFFYKIIASFLLGIFWVFSWFIPRVRYAFAIRKESWENLPDWSCEKVYWLHAASFGELQATIPLIFWLKKSSCKILVSVFSDSAYRDKDNFLYADHIIAMPFDGFGTGRFLDAIRPIAIFYALYDVWPGFSRVAQKKNIPQFLFAASLRPTSTVSNPLLRPILAFFYRPLKAIYTISPKDAEHFSKIHKNSSAKGDPRIETIHIRIKKESLPYERELKNLKKPILIAGSSYPIEEISLLQDFFDKTWSGSMIIAPHEISTKHIDEICQICQKNQLLPLRTSEVTKCSQLWASSHGDQRLVLVDQFGQLPLIYKFAQVVYVGGGFGKGVHSILEPILWQKPIISGPKIINYPEASQLQKMGILSVANTPNEIAQIAITRKLGLSAKEQRELADWNKQRLGAGERIFQASFNLLGGA